MTIAPSRGRARDAENATLEELRVAMETAKNRRSYIRLAVIRSLLMGLERSVVAQQFLDALGEAVEDFERECELVEERRASSR